MRSRSDPDGIKDDVLPPAADRGNEAASGGVKSDDPACASPGTEDSSGLASGGVKSDFRLSARADPGTEDSSSLACGEVKSDFRPSARADRADWMDRERALIGDEAVERLGRAHAAVFGVGGVGGYALEGLARAGVGHIAVIDCDAFDVTNLNRQLLATRATVGRRKAEVAAERVRAIAPGCDVAAYDRFVGPDDVSELFDLCFGAGADAADPSSCAVCDCVDNVTAKLAIIAEASRRGIYAVSCMGTGNKLDPSRFRLTDVMRTSVCPLARVMRRELKARDLTCDAVWSDEEPVKTGMRRPASVSFVPPAAGMLVCAAAVKKMM